ncbi:MAG: efflux RND transporter periplasmic adaptor subunit [Bacteroidota bacterium]
MTQNHKIQWLFFFIGLSSLGLMSCLRNQAAVEAVKVRPEVSTVAVRYETIVQYLNLNAVTAFQKKDNIRSTITGYISNLTFKTGDYIEAGAIYCYITTKEQKALKNITSSDTTTLRFRKPIAIFCSASGIITAQQALQGDYSSEGDVLASVSEPSSLVVLLNVPYENHQYVFPGKSCEILLPDGKTIKTKISREIPTIDAASQSQVFMVSLSGQSLPENLNVTVNVVQSTSENALVVPRAAIQTNETQDEFWVMKLINDSLAVKSDIILGLQNDSMSEIKGMGISEHDKIIVSGAFELPDSSVVKTLKSPH